MLRSLSADRVPKRVAAILFMKRLYTRQSLCGILYLIFNGLISIQVFFPFHQAIRTYQRVMGTARRGRGSTAQQGLDKAKAYLLAIYLCEIPRYRLTSCVTRLFAD